MDLNGVLLRAVELGSTDVHLKYGQPPVCRIDGDLTPMADARPLDDRPPSTREASALPRRG